jgi:four helix bundle protein
MNGKIKTFRDLIAWQRAMELARVIYAQSRLMPDVERFGLINQMRRAAVSVPSNIAEGYARQSTLDYLKFLRIARGSLAELSTQFEIAVTTGLLKTDTSDAVALMEETDRVLQGLIRSLEASARTKSEGV